MTEPSGTEPTAPQPDAPGASPGPVEAPLAEPPPARPFASNSDGSSAATPLVPWEAPAPVPARSATDVGAYPGGRPAFTIGALLSDAFARYGADVLRLLVIAAGASLLGWLSSFATPPIGSDPFTQPRGSEASGLLSLLGFVEGMITTSAMFAIADAGPAVPFGPVIRRAVNRAGWVFLATIILAALLILLGIAGVIVAVLFGLITPALAIVPIIALIVVFIWVSVRLTLALPAVVADGYDSIEALKLSWRITKPTGVWLRLFGASLLLGLLVAPVAIGSALLVLPAMFSADRQLLLLLLPAISGAVLAPLTALLAYSAYRRLVVPHAPRWTELPPPSTSSSSSPSSPSPPPPPPPPAASPIETRAPASDAPHEAAPGFTVPRFGTAAKGLLALVLAFDVAGVVAIPYGFAQMEQVFRNGFPGFPRSPGSPTVPGLTGNDGEVFPGEVAFGAVADVEACTIAFPLFVASPTTEVEWVAALEDPPTPQDEVFLRVSRDGREVDTTLQVAGSSGCLGSETAVSGLVRGIYTYEILVNGSVEATGSLFVQ